MVHRAGAYGPVGGLMEVGDAVDDGVCGSNAAEMAGSQEGVFLDGGGNLHPEGEWALWVQIFPDAEGGGEASAGLFWFL